MSPNGLPRALCRPKAPTPAPMACERGLGDGAVDIPIVDPADPIAGLKISPVKPILWKGS